MRLYRNKVGAPVAVCVALLLGGGARAQDRGSLRFDLTTLRSTSTSCGGLVVEGSQIGAHLYPRAVLTFAYQSEPLVYRGLDVQVPAVSRRVDGELALSMGLFNRVELGIGIPVVLHQEGQRLGDPATDSPLLGNAALGDVRIVPKLRLFGSGRGFSLALLGEFKLPSAPDDALAGSGFAVAPQLLAGLRFGAFSLSSVVGYRVQPRRQLYSLVVDDQLLFGIAGEFAVTRDLSLLAEVAGATAAGEPFALKQNSPLSAAAGLRYRLGMFRATVAAGPGIVKGHGTPDFTLLASVGFIPGGLDSDGDRVPDRKDACPYSPEDLDGFADDDGCPDPDNDRDWIADKVDRCPNQAEDKDGFEDQDGCPDLDNDKDGIPDKDDKCPNQAEDKDGFADHDGCPDLDNDKDGIPDKDDKCPMKPETKNGVQDDDGCPEPDRDGDGIFDSKDKCPDQPEDKNGIQDDDGCPEDPDGDRIPNDRDRCPNEKETLNNYQDEDGCPDDPTPKVVIKRASIWTSEAIYFQSDSWDLSPRFRRMLRKMARAIVRQGKRIKMVYVEGHADSRGVEKYNQWLSFKRAKNVVRYLARQGVPRNRLRAVGWGVRAAGDLGVLKRDRRVLFHVVRREPKVKVVLPKKRRRVRP